MPRKESIPIIVPTYGTNLIENRSLVTFYLTGIRFKIVTSRFTYWLVQGIFRLKLNSLFLNELIDQFASHKWRKGVILLNYGAVYGLSKSEVQALKLKTSKNQISRVSRERPNVPPPRNLKNWFRKLDNLRSQFSIEPFIIMSKVS